MLLKSILCLRVNGQTVYKNTKKDICKQNGENITYRKNSAYISKLNKEVLKCKEV